MEGLLPGHPGGSCPIPLAAVPGLSSPGPRVPVYPVGAGRGHLQGRIWNLGFWLLLEPQVRLLMQAWRSDWRAVGARGAWGAAAWGAQLFCTAGRASAPRAEPPGLVPLGASSPLFCPMVLPPRGSAALPVPGPPPPAWDPVAPEGTTSGKGDFPLAPELTATCPRLRVPGPAPSPAPRPASPPPPPPCLPGEFVARTLPTAETWESAQRPSLIYF